MLIIQIPIVFFVGGLLAFFAGIFALLKILAWHYQSKMYQSLPTQPAQTAFEEVNDADGTPYYRRPLC